jgi:transcriptional regulator with XRE-family HTH domain
MASVNRTIELEAARLPSMPSREGRAQPESSASTQQRVRDEIERHVGRRIRLRRIMLGFTQEAIAQRLQITLQQAHKYERGITRISAARLLQFAVILDVSVDFFFEAQAQNRASLDRERQFLELARSFERMENDQQRLIILKVAQALVQAGD